MTGEEIERLLDLVGNRTDDLGRLTRKLIAEYLTLRARHGYAEVEGEIAYRIAHALLRAQQGDIDADGEVVDRLDHVLLARLKGAIGDHLASDITETTQVRLVLDLLGIGGARA